MAAIRKIVGRNRNLTSFNSNSNSNCSLIPPTLFISCRGIASKLFVGGTSSLSLNFLIYFHFEFKMILSWGLICHCCIFTFILLTQWLEVLHLSNIQVLILGYFTSRQLSFVFCVIVLLQPYCSLCVWSIAHKGCFGSVSLVLAMQCRLSKQSC